MKSLNDLLIEKTGVDILTCAVFVVMALSLTLGILAAMSLSIIDNNPLLR